MMVMVNVMVVKAWCYGSINDGDDDSVGVSNAQ